MKLIVPRVADGVVRLSLDRRLVNLLPVAQWTNTALTNSVAGRTMGRWP